MTGTTPTTPTTPRRPWLRRRHWSLGIVVLLLVVVALGYEYLSAPSTTQIGACRIVSGATPSEHSECAGDDLAGKDLSGRDLRLADLKGADLSGADLSGAILYGADLSGADLRGATFADSDLTQAKLTDAQLDDTDFTDAGINGMDVQGTVLAASQYSEWVDSDDPVLVTLTAGTQPGITDNSCEHREGLYYPGQNVVTCSLGTDANYDSRLSYGRTIELKQAPEITAPSVIRLRAGRTAMVQLRAESPFPAVVTAFSSPLPEGLVWNPDTQQISGTPAASAVGSRTLEFIAYNGRQVRQQMTITITR